MASDTDESRSTTTDGDSESTSSVTSVESVGSRKSTRLRRKKRHDDSLLDELEKKNPKQKRQTKKKSAPTKEFGIKPNPQSETARRANEITAKRLAVLLKHEQNLKSTNTQVPHTPLQNKNGGDGGQVRTPTTSASHISSPVNGSTAQFATAVTSTPSELTPRKAKLAKENEILKAQLDELMNNAKTKDNESGEVVINENIGDSDNEGHITVLENKENNDSARDLSQFEDGEDDRRDVSEPGEPANQDEGEDKNERKQKSSRKNKHKKKSMKKKGKKKKKKSTKKSRKHKRRRHSSSSSSSTSSDTASSSSSCSDRKMRNKKRTKVESDHLLFNSDSSDVEEIVKGSGIFMKAAALALVRRSAKSHTAAARAILVGVFKPEALTACSLKGHATKGPLGKMPTARPPLYGPGLDAVLEAALRVAKSRKLEVTKETLVNHELATKQSELRSAA